MGGKVRAINVREFDALLLWQLGSSSVNGGKHPVIGAGSRLPRHSGFQTYGVACRKM
jgi:hypothetical protein